MTSRAGVSGQQRQTYPSPQPRGRISFAISADGDSSGVDDLNFPRGDATGPSRLLTTRFQLSRSAYRVSLTYVPDVPWAKQRALTSLFTSTSQVGAVQAQQTGRLGHSEAEPRQIEVFAKQPAFHMFQSQQFHSPLDATSRRKAHANAVSQSPLFQWRASRQMSVKMIETCSPAFECPAVLNCPLRQATRHKSAAQNWGTATQRPFALNARGFILNCLLGCFVARSTPQCSFLARRTSGALSAVH